MSEKYLVALKDQPLFACLGATSSGHIGFVTFEHASTFRDIRNAERVAIMVEKINHYQVEIISVEEGRQRAALAENTHRLDELMTERYWRAQQEAEERQDRLLGEFQRYNL